jgi:hypothetical protein
MFFGDDGVEKGRAETLASLGPDVRGVPTNFATCKDSIRIHISFQLPSELSPQIIRANAERFCPLELTAPKGSGVNGMRRVKNSPACLDGIPRMNPGIG